MSKFSAGHAAGEGINALVRSCLSQLGDVSTHNLGFVYATDPLAPRFDELAALLQAETAIDTWVGTVGLGICASGSEYFHEPAISILTCQFASDSYRLLPVVSDASRLSPQLDRSFMAGLGIVHGDPRAPATMDLVAALAHDTGAFLVGGLTSADSQFPQFAGTLGEGGVSGVLIGGRVRVAVGLTQGCSPIGPAHVVGQCQDNVLVTLDNQPAYELLLEDLGVAEGSDPRPWLSNVHAAVMVSGSDTGDYLVRNLIGLDPEQGLVAIADVVEPGSRVMFVRRDAKSAARDLARMLSDLKGRAPQPKAGLYYSCLARGPSLFDEPSHELRAIADVFGDIAIAGFFGNGEISNDRIYGYTGVLTLFL